MFKKQSFRLMAALLAAAFALILGAIPSFAMTMGDYVRNLGEDKVIEQANQDTGGHFVPENVAGKRLRMFEVTPGQVQGPLFEWTQMLGSGLFTLTWGDPHGDAKNGRQRYIGYNYWDEDVTNPAFPHDDWPGGYLDDPSDPNWRWIEEPWRKFGLRWDFDSDNSAIGSAYLKAMQLGLLCYYWDVILDKEVFMGNVKANPAFWNNLHRYVHVLVPPTTYTWGMGRMWHQRADGSVWYISVPLVPTGLQLDCDLSARIEPEEVTALPGQDVEFTVYVKYKDPPQFVGSLGNLGAQELMPTYPEVEHVFGGQTEYPVLEPAGDSPPADGAGFLPLRTNGKEYAYKIRVKAKGMSSDVMAAFVPILASDRNPADNAVLGRIKVIAPDFYAKIDPHSVQAEPGQGLTFTATFGLKPTFPQAARALVRAFHVTGAEYPVTLEPLDGAPALSDDGVLFAPGQEFRYRVRVTAQEADSRVVVKINPVDTSEDADWSDNRDEAAVNVYRQQFQPGDRRLHLQAYSKPGEDLYGNWQPAKARDPFTAKWTDDVHATLTVERPTPPRGTLDWWEITWAKLTYPKRHPDFMFGNPLPPQGTVTINMDVPGRGLEATKQATAVFEEDWALDGFPVYNMETGEVMAENPKYYPISVQFKVTYQYHYIVCSGDPPSCEVVTVVDSYTDTATANLLVNGTGTVPYAH